MLQETSEIHLAPPLLKIAILKGKNPNFFLSIMENNTNRLNDFLHIHQSSYTKLPLELQITQKKSLLPFFFCLFLRNWHLTFWLQRRLSPKIWGWKQLYSNIFPGCLFSTFPLLGNEGCNPVVLANTQH